MRLQGGSWVATLPPFPIPTLDFGPPKPLDQSDPRVVSWWISDGGTHTLQEFCEEHGQ